MPSQSDPSLMAVDALNAYLNDPDIAGIGESVLERLRSVEDASRYYGLRCMSCEAVYALLYNATIMPIGMGAILMADKMPGASPQLRQYSELMRRNERQMPAVLRLKSLCSMYIVGIYDRVLGGAAKGEPIVRTRQNPELAALTQAVIDGLDNPAVGREWQCNRCSQVQRYRKDFITLGR